MMNVPDPGRQQGAAVAGASIAYHMPTSSQISVLETKVDSLVRQGQDTNETLKDLTKAVTQLAVIEERQTADRRAMDRAFTEISGVKVKLDLLESDTDGRLKILERKAPVNDLSNGLVARVVGLVISAVVGAALVLLLRQPPQSAPVFIQQAPSEQVGKPLP